MDPLGTTQFVLSAINYLRTAASKVKENKNECHRLCAHAGTLLDLIQAEYKEGVPESLDHRLAKLANTLLELSAANDELSRSSLFRRTITRDSISAHIQSAYRDISDAVQELNLGLQIDLRRFQQENEGARRTDTEEAKQNFERILRNGDDVLQELQIHKRQMQEAMLCLHQYLVRLPPSAERQLLEDGMFAMQRRSGPMKAIPDEFDITSFDVIVYHDKKLGEGGFAVVYEADWKGTKVAVKELEKGVPSSAIRQEIDVWKRLRHPRVLQFLGACTIAEPAFIVCALQSNGDVINYLRTNPHADRQNLLHDAALGLVYLHHNGVIHGDLKGTNVLVDAYGRACLADFGLSRIKIHSTTIRRTTHVSKYGTIRWMSPESMTLGLSNKKTDIYSFGMTMYEVFTGAPPFATIPDTLLLSIIYDRGLRPPRPDDSNVHMARLDDEVWQVITLCWAQKPEERLAASDVATRLKTGIASRQEQNHGEHIISATPSTPQAHLLTNLSNSRNGESFFEPNGGSKRDLQPERPAEVEARRTEEDMRRKQEDAWQKEEDARKRALDQEAKKAGKKAKEGKQSAQGERRRYEKSARKPNRLMSESMASRYDPSDSDGESTHSLPPRMVLRWRDGRPDVPIPTYSSGPARSTDPPHSRKSPSKEPVSHPPTQQED